jgi:hypothetical protein
MTEREKECKGKEGMRIFIRKGTTRGRYDNGSKEKGRG